MSRRSKVSALLLGAGITGFALVPIVQASTLNDLLNAGKAQLQKQQSGSTSASASTSTSLSSSTLSAGLKQALSVGTTRAVESLSKQNGYLNSSIAHIPLPGALASSAKMLRAAGMGTQVDAFETSMNHAAEKAVVEATPLFVQALNNLTLKDAQQIYSGGSDAATRYFETNTRTQLAAKFQPDIAQAMAQTGVTSYYQQLTKKIPSGLAALTGTNVDLDTYVTQAALDGLFAQLAQEEKAIRTDPAARTTDLLRSVFGQ
ncbi:DUF4197 domain-containing protein [Pokkaliibacter sp. CJK22405]|uniref:DUF4197 domain-containing protein n=1 Tax=Pokkaliibacter sp. CJK22405 TaxID=3384615 RepID=UPI003984A69D